MEIDMKSFGLGALCLVGACTLGSMACWAIIHRRPIAAALKGEPLPEPPEWHTWHTACKK